MLAPSNPFVSSFYEVVRMPSHSKRVIALWSCEHKLISCNAVRVSLPIAMKKKRKRDSHLALQLFATAFDRPPASLPRLSWPDLCGPTSTLHDREMAAKIDESYDISLVRSKKKKSASTLNLFQPRETKSHSLLSS